MLSELEAGLGRDSHALGVGIEVAKPAKVLDKLEKIVAQGLQFFPCHVGCIQHTKIPLSREKIERSFIF